MYVCTIYISWYGNKPTPTLNQNATWFALLLLFVVFSAVVPVMLRYYSVVCGGRKCKRPLSITYQYCVCLYACRVVWVNAIAICVIFQSHFHFHFHGQTVVNVCVWLRANVNVAYTPCRPCSVCCVYAVSTVFSRSVIMIVLCRVVCCGCSCPLLL